MTTPQFTISLIRELRGSPLTILVACILLEQSGQVPITAQLLKDVTGYRDHTVTDSLRALEVPTRQLVTRVVGGWRLAKDGFQLPLELSTGDVENFSENRDIRGFSLSSCPSFNKKKNKSLEKEEEEENESRDIRGFGFEANLKAAYQAGIRDPKAKRIAGMNHVTPQFIRDHVAHALAQGHELGTAISRIENNWPAPADKNDGHRYVTGEYANRIEH